MKEIIDAFLNIIEIKKVDYADIRTIINKREDVTLRNGSPEELSQSHTQGFGVRVLKNGRWGFASSNDLTAKECANITEQAIRIAEASSLAGCEPVRLCATEPVVDSYQSKVEIDPFSIPIEEKVSHLIEADKAMISSAPVSTRLGYYGCSQEDKHFASTEGSRIHQIITMCGGGLEAHSVDENNHQMRCYPNRFGGQFATKGYERFLDLDLIVEAPRVADECVALLSAPELPSGEATIIIGDHQLAMQIHESIGHAIELDRVLGWELAYAGGSFVKPTDRGVLKYGSKLLNITCDPTMPNGLGSYAYDDDGVKTYRQPLIRDGIFLDFLSSRDTAPFIGVKSNGCARATAFTRLPLVRMPNVNLEPGEMSFDELIYDTKDGYVLNNCRSWSIDDHRVNFQFGSEIAWEIKNGKLGRMFKNPNYTGISTEFWANLDATCNEDHWKLVGLPCGKGQPSQTAFVAHGCAPSRFRNVEVGIR